MKWFDRLIFVEFVDDYCNFLFKLFGYFEIMEWCREVLVMSNTKISPERVESSRKMNTQKLGSFIADRRAKKMWTQEELAQKLNVNKTSVSRWESGNFAPDIFKLIKLSELLDVTVYDLLCGEVIEEDGNDRKSEAAVNGIRLYSKVILKKCLIVFMVLLLIISVSFFIINSIKKSRKWDVYKLIDSSNQFDYRGYILKNNGNIIVSMNNIIYNGSEIGLANEMSVKDVSFNFYCEDKIVYTYYLESQNQLLSEVINHYNLFFELRDQHIDDINDCKLIISYTLLNDYKDNCVINLKYKK